MVGPYSTCGAKRIIVSTDVCVQTHSTCLPVIDLRGKAIGDNAPVDEQEELLEVVLAAVLVVEVIGMLPYIDSQQGRYVVAQRIIAVRQGRDLQFACGIRGQEDPARAKELKSGLVQLLHHGLEGAKGLRDEHHQFGGGLLGMLRGGQLLEEELVVEHLSGIVGQSASGRFAHDVAEGHALVLGVVHQLIEVVHIGLEVFAVVA